MPNIVVDDSLLRKIEEVVSQGCSTSQEIADAIGIKNETFKNIRLGKRGGKSEAGKLIGAEEKAQIDIAIKKGTDRQPLIMMPIAELALVKGIQGGYVEEVTEKTIYELDPVTKEPILDGNGNEIILKIEATKKTRYIPASTPLLIFALKNLSRRLDDADSLRWVNETVQGNAVLPSDEEEKNFEGFDIIPIVREDSNE